MLQYLIILLDDTSTSFCHYQNNKTEKKMMSVDTLRQAIRFAMTENLMIQFVYPDFEIPEEIQKEIDTIDHVNIKPVCDELTDVFVTNSWNISNLPPDTPIVLRTTKVELFKYYTLLNDVLGNVQRINIVITDIDSFSEEDFHIYNDVLAELSKYVESLYLNGKTPQLNILTDRMMLNDMNNCGAGETTVTLAPNGKFYVCPAFYFDDEENCIGNLEKGLDIKNKQLYKLDHAPICRNCDAWQCKRCVWLNQKTTLEVNTPGHEQCVIAHLERNASKTLLGNIRKHGTFLPDFDDIKDIDYLDPFDQVNH